jgi:hypothetical protein
MVWHVDHEKKIVEKISLDDYLSTAPKARYPETAYKSVAFKW